MEKIQRLIGHPQSLQFSSGKSSGTNSKKCENTATLQTVKVPNEAYKANFMPEKIYKDGYTQDIKTIRGIKLDFVRKGFEVDGMKFSYKNLSRFARVYDNKCALLFDSITGAYDGLLNKEYINVEQFKKENLTDLLNTSVHEGIHSLLRNLVYAWIKQFPEEYKPVTLQIIDTKIRNGESGPLVKGIKSCLPERGLITNGIKKVLPAEINFNDKEKIAACLEDMVLEDTFLNPQKYIKRINKYAKAHFTEEGINKINCELIPALSSANAKKLQTQLESVIPDLYNLIPKLQKIDIVNRNIEFIKAPVLTSEERNYIADFVMPIAKDLEKYTVKNSYFNSPNLNEKAKVLIKSELMPKLLSYNSNVGDSEKAFNSICDYIQVQANRVNILNGLARFATSNKSLPSIETSLTKNEKTLAIKVYKEYLSCTEGNLKLELSKVKSIPLSDDDSISYMFNWEELKTRELPYKYIIGKLDEKISGMEISILKDLQIPNLEQKIKESKNGKGNKNKYYISAKQISPQNESHKSMRPIIEYFVSTKKSAEELKDVIYINVKYFNSFLLMDRLQKLEKLREIKAEYCSNIELLKYVEKFLDINSQINNAPKDTEIVKKIYELRNRIEYSDLKKQESKQITEELEKLNMPENILAEGELKQNLLESLYTVKEQIYKVSCKSNMPNLPRCFFKSEGDYYLQKIQHGTHNKLKANVINVKKLKHLKF